jgi:hypothetical protein
MEELKRDAVPLVTEQGYKLIEAAASGMQLSGNEHDELAQCSSLWRLRICEKEKYEDVDIASEV